MKKIYIILTLLVTLISSTFAAKYQKVVGNLSDWSGTYIMVWEYSDELGVAWTGVDAAGCCEMVYIDGDTINTIGSTTITIAQMAGGYSIKVNGGTNDGKYISYKSKSNGMSFGTTAAVQTIVKSNGTVNITNEGGAVIRFNDYENQMRFRFYQSSSASTYGDVQLYQLVDTINRTEALTQFVGGQCGFYDSYSSKGSYCNNLMLYASDATGNYPRLGLRLYTTDMKNIAGTYATELGNIDMDYSVYMVDEYDEDAVGFKYVYVVITQMGSQYQIVGAMAGLNGVIYTVNVTMPIYWFNDEYYLEPEQTSTFELPITTIAKGEWYLYDYGELSYTMIIGKDTLELLAVLPSGMYSMPDGTYPIEKSEYDEDDERIDKDHIYIETGMFYSEDPMSSYLATESGDVYYLMSGTVTFKTEGGQTKIYVNATSYYGSTIIAYPQGEHPSGWQDVLGNQPNQVLKVLHNNRLQIIRNNRVYDLLGR